MLAKVDARIRIRHTILNGMGVGRLGKSMGRGRDRSGDDGSRVKAWAVDDGSCLDSGSPLDDIGLYGLKMTLVYTV